MTLTKNPGPTAVILISLSALIWSSSANKWPLAPALAQPGRSSSRKTAKSTATPKSAGADSSTEPEITSEIAALWHSPSSAFSAAFARVGEEPREQSIDNIRKFLGSGPNLPFGLSLGTDEPPTEKQAAAYALARLLTKGKNSQPSPDERKEALALYEKSAALNCLRIPSLRHMCELLGAVGDENGVRNILAKISDDPQTDSTERARAQYELAQSYMRTSQGQGQSGSISSGQQPGPSGPGGQPSNADAEQAKQVFLAIREKYKETEFAKGAAYYLAQLAMAEANGTTTPAAIAYLKEYIRWTANGRFSGEVADKLWALSQPQSNGAWQANANTQTSANTQSNGAGGGSGKTPSNNASSDNLPPGTNGPSAAGAAPPVVILAPAELEQIAAVYFKRGDWNRALTVYDRLGPEAKLLQRAQCYCKLGRKADAAAALLAAIRQDPASSNYDDYASTLCVPLTKDEATALWKSILAANPKHADHALYNIATRVEESEALPLLSKLLNQFPTSEHAPESLWWVFWYQIKPIYPASVVKEKEKVLALIQLADQGVARYPQHRVAARLAFWAGKLYEKLGQDQAAKKEYDLAADKWPTNYYAARARARLHYLAAAPEKRHDRGFSISANRMLSPQAWNWPQPPSLFSFDKVAPLVGSQAMVLAVTHQCDECLTKIDSSSAAKADSGPAHDTLDCLRSWLYLTQSMPIEGIRAAGKDLDGNPTKAPRWQLVYPWAYAGAINDAAHKNGVDPYLVHALIREESRYFAMAVSRSNAIGLMQLLPGTAYGVAKRIGLPLSSKDEIFIPENNIKMGTAYLAYTLGRFDGHAMLAVASYNGGPNAVKHWVDQFHAKGLSDWDVFVENIPFRETRDYVRKVFGSYWTYELIYQ